MNEQLQSILTSSATVLSLWFLWTVLCLLPPQNSGCISDTWQTPRIVKVVKEFSSMTIKRGPRYFLVTMRTVPTIVSLSNCLLHLEPLYFFSSLKNHNRKWLKMHKEIRNISLRISLSTNYANIQFWFQPITWRPDSSMNNRTIQAKRSDKTITECAVRFSCVNYGKAMGLIASLFNDIA